MRGEGCWNDELDDESRMPDSRETDPSIYTLPPRLSSTSDAWKTNLEVNHHPTREMSLCCRASVLQLHRESWNELRFDVYFPQVEVAAW